MSVILVAARSLTGRQTPHRLYKSAVPYSLLTFIDRPENTKMANMSAHGTGPRFLIADEHAMFAETLRVYLEKSYTVVGLSQDGHAMVADAMRLHPDVIVLDVGMPLMNGL